MSSPSIDLINCCSSNSATLLREPCAMSRNGVHRSKGGNDVLPSDAPRSRTMYIRRTGPPSATSYTLLFDVFQSQLFRIRFAAISPLNAWVGTNGFSYQDHSETTRCVGNSLRNRADPVFMGVGLVSVQSVRRYVAGWW